MYTAQLLWLKNLVNFLFHNIMGKLYTIFFGQGKNEKIIYYVYNSVNNMYSVKGVLRNFLFAPPP